MNLRQWLEEERREKKPVAASEQPEEVNIRRLKPRLVSKGKVVAQAPIPLVRTKPMPEVLPKRVPLFPNNLILTDLARLFGADDTPSPARNRCVEEYEMLDAWTLRSLGVATH